MGTHLRDRHGASAVSRIRREPESLLVSLPSGQHLRNSLHKDPVTNGYLSATVIVENIPTPPLLCSPEGDVSHGIDTAVHEQRRVIPVLRMLSREVELVSQVNNLCLNAGGSLLIW
jgi:hypothetical protein